MFYVSCMRLKTQLIVKLFNIYKVLHHLNLFIFGHVLNFLRSSRNGVYVDELVTMVLHSVSNGYDQPWMTCRSVSVLQLYYDVIKWKRFPRYWSFVRGIHWSPVDSSHKGQWRVALMFSLICAWTRGGTNNRDADDLRRHCIIMTSL